LATTSLAFCVVDNGERMGGREKRNEIETATRKEGKEKERKN
jgi:hypothetical protein